MTGTREMILVVERNALFAGDWPQGFIPLLGEQATSFLEQVEARLVPLDRAVAELDPSHKQPIPYCVILRGDEVFFVKRRKKQTEVRLHDMWSIGLGGHVGLEDKGGSSAVRHALERELAEELILKPPLPGPARFLGLLNDDGSEVGAVHFGLVFAQQVDDRSFGGIREVTKMDGAFLPVLKPGLAELPVPVVGSATLWQDPPRFESWSALLLEALPWLDPSEGPAGRTGTHA